jgi:hypothetical protein
MRVKMRDDLALRGVLVPAYEGVIYPDEGVDPRYLTADDLDGALNLPDLCKDNEPEYNFNRIKLKTGEIFYMHGVDLDWI